MGNTDKTAVKMKKKDTLELKNPAQNNPASTALVEAFSYTHI